MTEPMVFRKLPASHGHWHGAGMRTGLRAVSASSAALRPVHVRSRNRPGLRCPVLPPPAPSPLRPSTNDPKREGRPSTALLVGTTTHPRASLHRCRHAYAAADIYQALHRVCRSPPTCTLPPCSSAMLPSTSHGLTPCLIRYMALPD